ncbi:MAG: hypothetical protein WDN47_00645 [Candidatus Doudnabacteria bacterium]
MNGLFAEQAPVQTSGQWKRIALTVVLIVIIAGLMLWLALGNRASSQSSSPQKAPSPSSAIFSLPFNT